MYEIVVLNLEQDLGFEKMIVHPVVLVDNSQLVLIDCGFINSLEKLKEEFVKNDLKIENLKKIVVTHHDHDHIANLADLKHEYPSIEIYASKEEQSYIEGDLEPFRLTQAQAMQGNLDDEQKEWGLKFIELLKNVKTVKVDKLVKGGDIIPFNTKVEVIETFGHLSGHISIYIPASRTLIAGDALVIDNDELILANPELAFDLRQAKESILKIMDFNIEKIICYHGGIMSKNIESQLRKIVK